MRRVSLTSAPTVTLYKGGAVAWVGPMPAYAYAVATSQGVDSIFVVDNANGYATDTLALVPAAHRVYHARTWCDAAFNAAQQPLSPVTVEEVTP